MTTATITRISKKIVREAEKLFGVSDLSNQVINCDVFYFLDKIESNTYDLIVIDPPYNLSKKFNKNSFSKMEGEEYKEYLRSFIKPCKRVLKENGSIYVCCDWGSSYLVEGVLREFFEVKTRITWKRDKGRASKTNWKNNLEDIFYCVNDMNNHTFNQVKIKKSVIAPYKKDGVKRDWFTDTNGKNYRFTACGNLLDNITIPFWSMKENTPHPTQKPEKLMAKLIYASSNEGDLILDLFAGSGTTSATAIKMKRNFTALENDSEYIKIIKDRVIDAYKNNTIQGYLGDGRFLERNSR